jgi:hypothetical protein
MTFDDIIDENEKFNFIQEVKTCTNESNVESLLYLALALETNGKITPHKKDLYGNRRRKTTTDGEFSVKINDREIWGLLEVKFKRNPTKCKLKEQLAQSLYYSMLKFMEENIMYDFMILVSESYYLTVQRSDVEDLILDTIELFEVTKFSPSAIWNDKAIRAIFKQKELKFDVKRIEKGFNLSHELLDAINNAL